MNTRFLTLIYVLCAIIIIIIIIIITDSEGLTLQWNLVWLTIRFTMIHPINLRTENIQTSHNSTITALQCPKLC